MPKNKVYKIVLTSSLALSVFAQNGAVVKANTDNLVTSVVNENSKITLKFKDQSKMQIHFLQDDMFRVQKVAETGNFVDKIATPLGRENAHIIVKPDAEYPGSAYAFSDTNNVVTISNKELTLTIDKAKGTLKLTKPDGSVVFEEKQPIELTSSASSQTLKNDENEYFFGGGTQNGRFSHKGNRIEIVNTNNWVDGGVASPNPFYWSTNGYGVVRNTYAPGYYDFGKTQDDSVVNQHGDARFDAYYFTGDSPANLLNDYVTLTGKPAQLPDYAYYLAHLNCYNRDFWVSSTNTNDRLIDGNYYREYDPRNTTPPNGAIKETLMPVNGNDIFTAKHQIDLHIQHDMPLGWFLPNDGYGCGFGQDSTSLDNNVQNLKAFADYAESVGVKTGLWTQSDLTPKGDNVILQRDFDKEVNVAGVRSLKTDVAWVGPGYTFGLNGLELAAKVLDKAGEKHNVVTLDGWAGTQRYGGIWSGDQTGGQWEYIRFHIPTFIGTGLSGNPHIGSDMDGIFGGKNPIIQVRDFQYKAFAGYMLDMDGWGSSQKNPWEFGGEYTDINRAYLKLKAQLLPYTATESEKAHQSGLPILRAMMLEYPSAYTYSDATQYQYLWGSNFLVAPVYQNTNMAANGNDVRNDIYLPNNTDGSENVWIDYITKEAYRGGSILNNFDAPLWKLPVFVKNGSIIPMYEENNNPLPITATNPKGLDRSHRVVEFYPFGSTEYTHYEDDGLTKNGASISTKITSVVQGDKATLTAHPAVANKDVSNLATAKDTKFIVNVSKEPTAVKGTIGSTPVTFTKVNSLEDFNNATGNVYFYDAKPQSFIQKYANAQTLKDLSIITKPQLLVKSSDKVNVLNNKFEVVVEGFENAVQLSANKLNTNLNKPVNLVNIDEETTSKQVKIAWDNVPTALTYDVLADGNVYTNLPNVNYVHEGLRYSTSHTYQVRAVNLDGYSEWSDPITVMTKDDPYRNVPTGMTMKTNTTDQGGYEIKKLFDHDEATQWHTKWGTGDFHTLDINLNGSYAMDRFEYLPREDAGNGTFLSGTVSVSRDGVNYKEVGTFNWTRNAERKVFNFPSELGRFSHIRLSNVVALGNFGSGRELTVYTKDPKRQFTSLDYNDDKVINEGEVTFLQNYAGLSKLQSDNDWGYVEIADVNYNQMIDATDISAVTRMLNGGVNYYIGQHAQGKMKFIADKEEVKANEIVTVKLYGFGLENVNAITAVLPVDMSKFDQVEIKPTIKTAHMSNFSTIRQHSNRNTNAFVLLANTGTQELVSGDGALAKITLRAKVDTTFAPVTETALITNRSLVEDDAKLTNNEITEVVSSEEKVPTTAITSVLAHNDFTNGWIEPTRLMQGGNYKNLYDGNPQSESEFKWYLGADSFTSEVSLPTDFKFTLDSPKVISKFVVRNRNNLNGNGAIKSIKASYVAEDDSVHELQTFNEKVIEYTFTLPANTVAKAIIVTPLTSNGTAPLMTPSTDRMLTFSEVTLYSTPVKATSIDFEGLPTVLRKGEIKDVHALVSPSNAANKLYTITSLNPDVVAIERYNKENAYGFLANPIKAGEATLKVTLNADPSITKEVQVQVDDSLNETVLNEVLDKANTALTQRHLYKTVDALEAKVSELTSKQYSTQDDIDEDTLALRKLVDALVYAGSNENVVDSDSQITTPISATATSFAQAEDDNAGKVLDNDPSSVWHSNYATGYTLPQSVTLDLGSEKEISQVNYLARQTSSNGHITQYRIEVSVDNVNFTPVVAGYFDNNGAEMNNFTQEQKIKFTPVNAKYVRFVAEKTIGSRGNDNNRYASIAELKVFEAEKALTLQDGGVILNSAPGVLNKATQMSAAHKQTGKLNDKDVDVYDINLSLNGGTTQPKGEVLVTLPADPTKVVEAVYYVEDGQFKEQKEIVNYTANDATVTFKTTHFSEYAVVYETTPTTPTNPTTPTEPTNPTTPTTPGTDVKPVQPGNGNVQVVPVDTTKADGGLSVKADTKTNDNTYVYVSMALLSLAAVLVLRKRNTKI